MDLAEGVDCSHQVPLGLVAMTPDPISSVWVAFLPPTTLLQPPSCAFEEACPLPLPGGELSLLPRTRKPFSCVESTGFSPQNSKARKGKGILLWCVSLLFSINQHRVDRGRCGGHLGWDVTKGGFPPEPQSFHPGSLEETSTVSAQVLCRLSSMLAQILSTFSQGFLLLLGRWLAVVSRIRQGSR